MKLVGEEKGRVLELADELSFDDPRGVRELLFFAPFEPKISTMS